MNSGESDLEDKSGSSSEDDDLFQGKYAKKKEKANTEGVEHFKPVEDAARVSTGGSPWEALPEHIRSKLQMITAELLDLLPVSECTLLDSCLDIWNHVLLGTLSSVSRITKLMPPPISGPTCSTSSTSCAKRRF